MKSGFPPCSTSETVESAAAAPAATAPAAVGGARDDGFMPDELDCFRINGGLASGSVSEELERENG